MLSLSSFRLRSRIRDNLENLQPVKKGRQGIFPICFTEPVVEDETPPTPPSRIHSILPSAENEKENKVSKLSNWKRSKSPETTTD